MSNKKRTGSTTLTSIAKDLALFLNKKIISFRLFFVDAKICHREYKANERYENLYLNVMIQSGYYDGACTYFDAKYSMWNMDPSGRFKNRMRFEGYRSGHMMYLRREDLEKSNEDFRDFILKSLPAKGVSAKY